MNPTRLTTIVGWILVIGLFAGILLLPTRQPSQVVVNMPADAKPLPALTSDVKVITSDRAVLWYAVFSKMVDRGYNESAVLAAHQAVDKIYGPAKP